MHLKEIVMNKAIIVPLLLAAFASGLVGCSTAPKTEEKREALSSNVQSTLDAMRAEDPGFGAFIDAAHAYAVYPTVGRGAFIFGGAYGKGHVYEKGKFIGYSDMSQATVGAQIGGEGFAQVIAFENRAALDRFISKEYAFTAEVKAVALKSGAAKQARFQDGIAVFQYTKGGLMAAAAVGGQRFRFKADTAR
jgi:lipid-binding SYLF domain-containing protein